MYAETSLPDDLEQRSIVIEMQRRRADEAVAELREDRCEPLQNLARMCARWADDFSEIVRDYDPDMDGLINRVADNWRPLFAIADTIGSDWPARAREAAETLAPREIESTGPMLLADIRVVFDEKNSDRLSSTDACKALNEIEGRPWADWKGKGLTPNQLARLLKPFSVRSDNVRISSQVLKGYTRQQFEELWQRYLSAQGVYEPLQRYNTDEIDTSCTFQTATRKTDVADQKCEKPATNGHCSGVAVSEGVVSGGNRARQCDQCGKPGNLGRVDYGDLTAWLHRDCRNAWRADQDKSGVQVVSRHPMHPNGGGL